MHIEFKLHINIYPLKHKAYTFLTFEKECMDSICIALHKSSCLEISSCSYCAFRDSLMYTLLHLNHDSKIWNTRIRLKKVRLIPYVQQPMYQQKYIRRNKYTATSECITTMSRKFTRIPRQVNSNYTVIRRNARLCRTADLTHPMIKQQIRRDRPVFGDLVFPGRGRLILQVLS